MFMMTGMRSLSCLLSVLTISVASLCAGCGWESMPVVMDPVFSPTSGSYAAPIQVSISDPTPGASIYYTTNGSTPTANSMRYSGAFTVSTTETIEAIAVATGYANSFVVATIYTIAPTMVATSPMFSPPAGSYTATQSVSISDVTPGATIYYTTNGTTPTTSSAIYGGPITVSSTETVEAFAVAAGYANSAVATATYTIALPVAATPIFSPVAGSYAAAQSVTISDTTPGATIYYTTNGSVPTTSSTPYTGAILVTSSETISAIAVATGYSNSAVAIAAYTITLPAAATPTFSPAAGTYATTQSVTISDTTPGATIYYTTNGSAPTTSSTPYTGAISVASSETISAIAMATGYSNSAVATATYRIGTASTENEWTWMAGSNVIGAAAVYGTMGTPAASNTPGSRGGESTFNNGSFWLFGGAAYNAATYYMGALNDLWKFDPTTSEWTWMSGSNTPNPTGVYGTKGTAASGNAPQGRSGNSAWTDSSGNLWIFGGGNEQTVPILGTPIDTSVELDDLWEFNPVSLEWTWVSGTSGYNQAPTYGTLGVAAASNDPGSRSGAPGCTDSAGNFWLFGGFSQTLSFEADGYLNDLWEFNPTTKEWTWASGSQAYSQPGVYGTQGVAATGNTPGGRISANCWADSAGNIWLFGGIGYDSSTNPDGYMELNDLWKFNTSTKLWTWVSGIDGRNDPGVYGTQGVPSVNNVPSGRDYAANWTDSQGNLWLFGGAAVDTVRGSPTVSNDLWKFNPATQEWTWMAGSSLNAQNGNYGILGVPSASNEPGGRDGNATWIDGSGNLWLFGELAEDSTGNGGFINDVWRYQP